MAKAERSKTEFDRYLEYKARHSGWITFRSIYWAIYLLLIGAYLIYFGDTNMPVSWTFFFGTALVLLSIMIILYGAAESLHHKLMRTYS